MHLTDLLYRSQAVGAVVGLIVIWFLETWIPFATERRERSRHAIRNLALALLNAIVLSVVFAVLTASVVHGAERAHFGLLRWLDLPAWPSALLAILALDGWMYLWHRANHAVPLLWRFHRVHHSDLAPDVTTATRFHVGEIIFSSLLRLAVVPLIGASLWQVLLYELLLLPAIQLHHSNVGIPERWDRWLRRIIVSPNMHRVHHSRCQPETDSNFSSLFSFWDRLAGTFRQREDPKTIPFGLDEFEDERWQTVSGLLLTPFASPSAEQPPRTTLAQDSPP